MRVVPTPIRVGFVGCGRIARVHESYVSELPHVRLVAVCDVSEEAARAFAGRKEGVRWFGDFRSMLSAVELDAVHVLTPPQDHARTSLAALEAGLHVLVEKPMALRVADAERVVEVARRVGRSLVVDHNRKFDPPVRRVRAMVERGELGEIVGVEAFQGGAAEPGSTAPRGDWKGSLPAGPLEDVAPHPVYLLREFAGELREPRVEARAGAAGLEEVRALARGSRSLGTLSLSMSARPVLNGIRILGTRATAEVDLNTMTLVVRRPRTLPKLLGKVVPNLEQAGQLLFSTVRNSVEYVRGRQRLYPGMGELVRRFYLHLAAGSPPPTTPEEGLEVVAFLERMWELASGAPAAEQLCA
ncbi:MAG: hypothetical protein KatS3mg076_0456 [Candidatus Binatia bacterium]|nr:MAG: hypothetical protein KatS3mg076_0456 [Candidatus Binatia bacterium]